MFCGSCGKQMPDGSGFCPSCGAAAGAGGAQQGAAATGASAGPTAAAAQRAKIEAQLKAGSQDAMAAFMVLLKDPVGGLAKSFSMFDSTRALIVGGIFGGAYAVAATIGAVLLFNSIMGMVGLMMGGGIGAGAPGLGGGASFQIIIRMFFIYIIQAAALMLGCLATRMIFKGSGDLASDIYIGGSCLLPAAAGVLAGSLLGYLSFWLLILLYIFAGCYTIMMLYSGATKITKLPEIKAALSVPVVLCIAGGITYIVLRVILL
jgi:zinc-ribbon domain